MKITSELIKIRKWSQYYDQEESLLQRYPTSAKSWFTLDTSMSELNFIDNFERTQGRNGILNQVQSSKWLWKNKGSRFRMLFKKPFNLDNAKFLLANGIYNYFSIGVLIEGLKSFEALIFFIENLDEYASFLFYETIISIDLKSYDVANKVLKLYMEKGFDMSVISVNFKNKTNDK